MLTSGQKQKPFFAGLRSKTEAFNQSVPDNKCDIPGAGSTTPFFASPKKECPKERRPVSIWLHAGEVHQPKQNHWHFRICVCGSAEPSLGRSPQRARSPRCARQGLDTRAEILHLFIRLVFALFQTQMFRVTALRTPPPPTEVVTSTALTGVASGVRLDPFRAQEPEWPQWP